MAVWRVQTQGDVIHLGEQKRKMLTRQGCNEPFHDSYWCPKRKWFRKEPCPFINKNECNTCYKMTGSI